MNHARSPRPADHPIPVDEPHASPGPAAYPEDRASSRPAPAGERADRWVSRVATATVAGLAGIAGAISYSHMRQLAAAHGDTGWHAHAFPLSVDGVEIVASLVLLADRRAGRTSGWLPWAALTSGTAASLAANIATAGHGTISRIIAGWPAVALLIAVKLLSGIFEHRTSTTEAASSARSDPRAAPVLPAGTCGAAPHRLNRATPAARRPSPDSQATGGTAPDDTAALEQAARVARDELQWDRPAAHPRRTRHPAPRRRPPRPKRPPHPAPSRTPGRTSSAALTARRHGRVSGTLSAAWLTAQVIIDRRRAHATTAGAIVDAFSRQSQRSSGPELRARDSGALRRHAHQAATATPRTSPPGAGHDPPFESAIAESSRTKRRQIASAPAR